MNAKMQEEAARRKIIERLRQDSAAEDGLRDWHCKGLGKVKARTKSEARAKFKALQKKIEELSFNPRPVKLAEPVVEFRTG